jgi:hypothetical protein
MKVSQRATASSLTLSEPSVCRTADAHEDAMVDIDDEDIFQIAWMTAISEIRV